MKIRQAQTSATYISAGPGELNKRVLIRLRVDMPADNFGVEPQLPGYVPDMGEGYPDQCHHWQETAQTRGRHHPLHHHSLPPGDHR